MTDKTRIDLSISFSAYVYYLAICGASRPGFSFFFLFFLYKVGREGNEMCFIDELLVALEDGVAG